MKIYPNNNLLRLAGFGLVFVCVVIHADTTANQNGTAVAETLVNSRNATVSQGKAKFTCACDENTPETPICANNGVTYKSPCRFDCAKARVTRLRKVKNGPCSQSAGAKAYWQG